jgi:hypothetical protein
MSYDNLSSVSQNVLKFYQKLTGEERRIPLIFDDFHFWCCRVIGLDMTENRIFTLCRMIIWVVFLRMFWNFTSSLPVKRGSSLSFFVGTISNVLVMEIGWTDVGSGGYILVSCAHSNTSLFFLWNCFAKWTEIWWEAPMEGSLLSFLKAEWKVRDTGSAHRSSSCSLSPVYCASGHCHC